MKKVISAFVLICVLVSVLCGCSLLSAKSGSDKEFSGEGLTITLTDNFRTAEIEGYTLCYDSFDVAVYALKESFEVFENAGLTMLLLMIIRDMCWMRIQSIHRKGITLLTD